MSVSIQTILFDLDGTLIDSAPGILEGFSHVLNSNGILPLKPLIPSMIGPPLIPTLKMLSGVADKQKLHEMAEEFKNFYDLEACISSRPYEGVCEGLKKLSEAGIDLHISTNKRYAPTVKIVEHFAWNKLFSSIYTLDREGLNFKSKSEMIAQQLIDFDLSLDHAIYVGDRHEDMEAAKNNKLNFIGATWGYGDFKGRTLVINSFDQLNELINS